MISFLKKAINSIGFDLVKRPLYKGKSRFEIQGFNYTFIRPSANFSPWAGDSDFQEIFKIVRRKFTLVDIYRAYELWQIVEKVNELDSSAAILEVGVWRGGTGAIMAKKLKSINASSQLYLADTFSGVVKTSDLDTFYTGGEHSDTSLELVQDLISREVNYPQITLLKGIFPEDTKHLIPENTKFSLCHIDVDVYQSAKEIEEWIWPKLIRNGMIVFDDYGFHWCPGITKFVEEQRHLKDRIVIYNLNGHAIIIKLTD